MENNLATALEKVKARSARVVVMTKERVAVTAKYVKLRSSVEQRLGFASNEMVCLEAKVVKISHEWDVRGARAEQLSLKAQCAPGLAVDIKTLRERMSTLETAACTKISNSSNNRQ